MGIPIQQWRCAIGCYSSNLNRNLFKKNDISHNRSSSTEIPNLCLFAIVLVAVFSISSYSIISLLNSGSPSSLPPTSPLGPPPTSPSTWTSSTTQGRSSSWYQWLSNKKKNKLVRAKNGNRQNRGIKLAHWNAGSAHLKNKMHEIEQVVAENRPHILGISEANLK